jgi:hypothetical protein
MTEYAILTLYVFIIGTQVGRALTLRQRANAMVEAVNCMINSDWLAPQILAARIHSDQELIEVPEFKPSLTLRCRMIHESVRARAR